MSQMVSSLPMPMEKFIHSYVMAERASEEVPFEETDDEEPPGFMSYTGVFLDDEEEEDGDDSSTSTNNSSSDLLRLHAALTGTALASGSVSGAEASSPSSEDKEKWKVALVEGLEDFLAAESAGGSGGSSSGRRFSFDLTNTDMQALEALVAGGTVSGPSSRRGSFSLSFLEAENMLPKLPMVMSPRSASAAAAVSDQQQQQEKKDDATTAAAPAPATNKAAVVQGEKMDVMVEDDDEASNTSSLTSREQSSVSGDDGSSSSSSSSSSSQSNTGGRQEQQPSAKRRLGSTSTDALGLISAASLLPMPQTPLKPPTPPPMSRTSTMSSSTSSVTSVGSSYSKSGPPLNLPVIPNDGIKRIGIYTIEERKARIARFQGRRHRRIWKKKIKYDCRKKLADNRPRVKGRFVKREDEIDIIVGGAVAAATAAAGTSASSQSSLIESLMGLDELLNE